jgi:hypothetical protein
MPPFAGFSARGEAESQSVSLSCVRAAGEAGAGGFFEQSLSIAICIPALLAKPLHSTMTDEEKKDTQEEETGTVSLVSQEGDSFDVPMGVARMSALFVIMWINVLRPTWS